METLVDIHTHRLAPSDGARRLVCVDPSVRDSHAESEHDRFCSGIHPWDCVSADAEARFARIASDARLGRISAIGETGLDRLCQSAPLADQTSWFGRHIALSEETGLPLVVHSVRTDSDILAAHARTRPKSPWIIHACSAKGQGLEQILSRRIAVSFGPRELSRPGARQRLERAFGPLFFLETDDTDRTIAEVHDQASRLLGIPRKEIVERILSNWTTLFGT